MTNDPAQNPYTSPSTSAVGPHSIRSSASTNTIVSLGLVMGVCTITAVMLFMFVPDTEEFSELLAVDPDDYVFLAIGFGLCIAGAVLSVLMRRYYRQSASTQFLAEHENVKMPSDTESVPGNLLGMLATANIVGGALLEGPALINAIFMLIRENLWHLIPVLVAILGILITMPTASRTRHYVEDIVSRS